MQRHVGEFFWGSSAYQYGESSSSDDEPSFYVADPSVSVSSLDVPPLDSEATRLSHRALHREIERAQSPEVLMQVKLQ